LLNIFICGNNKTIMTKVHSRIKRKLGISTHKGTHLKQYKKKKRSKSFKTEELAKRWAAKNNIKNFELINLRNELSKSKKIKVIILK